MQPIQLRASFEERIWGRNGLAPWFPAATGRVGEVTFLMPDGSDLPILVKFIFTSERLSVQVHPDDAYALKHEGRGGKNEMWYVLAAEPDAMLAAGLRQALTRDELSRVASSGEIEHLLHWWPVSPDQVYFIPAGTVHTLGAGITVCEIQQANPITYRLYDYGRDRELHLERALDVSRREDHPGPSAVSGPVLASCSAFAVERVEIADSLFHAAGHFQLLIVLKGSGRIGDEPMAPGQVWYVPAGTGSFHVTTAPGALLLKAYVPPASGAR